MPPTQTKMTFEQLLLELARAHGWKAGLSIILSWLGIHLMPIAGFILVVIVLGISDWITGVTAARIKKEAITSRGLFRSVRKIVFYCLAIVLVVIVENTFFASTWLVYLVAVYIALVELYSNLENISVITGTNILGIVRKGINAQLAKVNLTLRQPSERAEEDES